MDFNSFVKVAVEKVEHESSVNNPNTKRVIRTYIYVMGGKTFRLISTKVYDWSGKQRANKKHYSVDSKGVCKREFFTQLNTDSND